MSEHRLYSLTNAQKLIGYAGAIYPKSAVNNIGGSLLIEDDLDFELLEKTLHLCIDRNDSLRLRFINSAEDADPISQYFMLNSVQQYVSDEPHGEIRFADLSEKTSQDIENSFLEWNKNPVNIFQTPIYEFTMVKAPDGRCGIFSKIDHMGTDAWMSMMLCKEVIEVYYALKNGKDLPPPAFPYTGYIRSETEYLASDRFKRDEEYWLELYKEKFKAVDLASGTVSETGATRQKVFRIDKETAGGIYSFCNENRISPASLFNTALGMYIYKVSDITDVMFGSTCILRSTRTERHTCGAMVNNMNMRLKFDENSSFRDVCISSADSQMRMLMHMRYPQLNLMMNIYKMHQSMHMWDTLIGYQIGRIRTREDVRFQTQWYTSGSFAIPLYISVTDMDDTGEYILYYEYQTDRHTPERIDEIHKGITDILSKGISAPGTPLRSL